MKPDRNKMLAASSTGYNLENLSITEIEIPSFRDDEILIKVHAASMNPYDWHQMTGTPYLMRISNDAKDGKCKLFGTDFSGIVAAKGKNVEGFEIGDEVFGFGEGTFAEYVVVNQDKLVLKPKNISFEEAASVPIAGSTALQGLQSHAKLKPNTSVLISGASGGVGTLALQIAKYTGAKVTAVCSSKNSELVKKLGADNVLNYDSKNYHKELEKYDVIFDAACKLSPIQNLKMLNDKGLYIAITGSKNKFFGPIGHWLKSLLLFQFSNKTAKVFITEQSKNDLLSLSNLLEQKVIRPVISANYKLNQIKDAFNQVGDGHTKGKIIVNIF